MGLFGFGKKNGRTEPEKKQPESQAKTRRICLVGKKEYDPELVLRVAAECGGEKSAECGGESLLFTPFGEPVLLTVKNIEQMSPERIEELRDIADEAVYVGNMENGLDLDVFEEASGRWPEDVRFRGVLWLNSDIDDEELMDEAEAQAKEAIAVALYGSGYDGEDYRSCRWNPCFQTESESDKFWRKQNYESFLDFICD